MKRFVVKKGARRRSVHIINPFGEIGGSEMRALSLYQQLAPYADVSLWSEYTVAEELAQQFPIRTIAVPRLQFPRFGTFIIVGVYFRVGRWYYLSCPRRVILVNNIPRSHSFEQRMRKLTWRGMRHVEVVFASQQQKAQFDQDGLVEYSMIDLARFRPGACTRKPGAFTVGRLSRDVQEKHHDTDPQLYRRLVNAGCQVRILGGMTLSPALAAVPGIELMPVGAEDPVDFLGGLDAFYYRTADDWFEPYGRVVAEAMACGLPVVCHQAGGYAEIIDDGRDGFLFDSQDEAMNILLQLRENPSWCHEIGCRARAKVEAIYSPQQRQIVQEYYLA